MPVAGIIDILQSFGITKKLEHTFKSLITDGDTVSVHRPSFYAARFKKFMVRNRITVMHSEFVMNARSQSSACVFFAPITLT
jgi:hypothetical protein